MTFGDSEEADPLFRPPFDLTWSLEFAGRWRFRVGKNPKNGKLYGVDSVGYRLLVWRRPRHPATSMFASVSMHKLDPLPAASRRWRKTASGLWVKPGAEYLHGPASADPLDPAVRDAVLRRELLLETAAVFAQLGDAAELLRDLVRGM